MAMIDGVRDTNTIIAATRKLDTADRIALLEPDAAPLTVILKMARKRKTTDPKFRWFEDVLGPRWDTVNYSTGYTTSETSIVVDNGAYFKANDLVKVTTTAEVVLVTAVSTNTLTVTRAFGETAAGAVADGGKLLILGNLSEEGADAPAIKTTQKVEVYNFTTIVRTPLGLTGTEAATDLYGEKDLPYQRRKAAIEHMKDIENRFLFSERKEDTSGTHPKRSTRGLIKWITTNVTDAGNTLTEAEFNTFLESVFRYGSKKKMLIACSKIVSALDSWGRAAVRVLSKDQTYGISVKQYLTSHGTLNVTKHDLLEEFYNETGFALEPASMWYRPLQGAKNRDTHLRKNIQDNKNDSEQDEWMTEVGLHLEHQKKHGRLHNVDQYSA